MDIRLLGPVQAWDAGRRLDLGSRQQRLILAILALEPGRPVVTDRLIGLLWPDGLPKSDRAGLYTRIAELRTALGEAAPIRNCHGGYALEVDADAVDVCRFRGLIERARTAGDDGGRVALLRAALALWSGPALGGVADGLLRNRLCGGLEEARLVAYENRIAAELRLGQASSLLDELVELVDGNPARERLVRHLMLTSYRSGQIGRALDAARSYRRHLAEELGLDPGPAFLDLEAAILRADASLGSAPVAATAPGTVRANQETWPYPEQLPPVAAGFTGRTAEFAELDGVLSSAAEGDPSLVVLTGAAGAGKTALAVRWAQRIAQRFPHGRLYLDLRGNSVEPPLTPGQALAALLAGLGVDRSRIPAEPDAASALLRTMASGRRVLLLLDNAAAVEQVRPLLLSESGQLVVVTSRRRMSQLVAVDGAHRIALGHLKVEDAERLLTRLIGRSRAVASSDAIRTLARAGSRLPLALRIAASRIIDDAPDDAADQEIGVTDLGLLAVRQGQLHRAAELAERAVAVGPTAATRNERARALANLGLVGQQLGRPTEALAHLEAAETLADGVGRPRTQIQVQVETALVRINQGRPSEALRRARTAAALADRYRQAGLSAQARAAMSMARIPLGQLRQALADIRDAVTIARSLDHREAEVNVLVCQSVAELTADEPTAALAHAAVALRLAADHGYRVLEGHAYIARSEAEFALGRPSAAVESAGTALTIHADTGHHLGLARSHRALGRALRRMADGEADRHLAEAVELFDAYGCPEGKDLQREVAGGTV